MENVENEHIQPKHKAEFIQFIELSIQIKNKNLKETSEKIIKNIISNKLYEINGGMAVRGGKDPVGKSIFIYYIKIIFSPYY